MKKLIAALLFVPTMAQAEFYSGNDLLAKMNGEVIDRMQAMGFVQGVYDVYVHITFCPPNNEQGITAGQVRDMAHKYLINNPNTRQRTAQALINDAFKQAWPCANKSNGRGA